MAWRVEIKDKEGVFDAAGDSILRDIEDLGIGSVENVRVVQVFLIEAEVTLSQVQQVCQELLVDPIIQDYVCKPESSYTSSTDKNITAIEIAYHLGVMDPVEASTLKGIQDLGIHGPVSVRTARRYLLYGKVSQRDKEIIVNRVLANKLIQHVVGEDQAKKRMSPSPKKKSEVKIRQVDLLSAGDQELARLSAQGQLFLNLNEMKAIQKHFRQLKRNPTDCELETIAQTWSEHCNHKTFRGNIEYTIHQQGKNKVRKINNLLKSTIMKATHDIAAPWCVSVFHDNSGVIEFDQDHHVCFKVETHNHPSALEPFGGANTGIGGVIRDSLGTGLGAKPIANTDVFCFAPPSLSFDVLPEGTLHPKRVMKGVVNGVRDYGNKMGIPTVNGAVVFDQGFVGNPLVFCGTVGILPKDKVDKKASSGELIVAVGGRTGRDGIHGATFSSGELTEDSETVSSGAVQIGNPIEEKKVLDVLLKARDQRLYTAITDCGAGGFSSAVGEMGALLGCRVDLDKAPVKYEGLSYEEIWISESQERMVISVPRRNIKKLLDMFDQENVEATVIGEFTSTKRLELFYHGVLVCDLDMDFLHDGVPKVTKKAVWKQPVLTPIKISSPKELTEHLYQALSHLNVCSKENIIRRYDHEVQGSSVIKPLVGPATEGPSDASVIRPKLDSDKGLAIANGINIRYGMIDPYWMAASCVDEAIRQIIAVGGKLNHIAILDNFCWGNPDKPDRLGGLVRCAQGCYDVALGYHTPFISGKDSFYNEYAQKGKTLSIPGTLLISAIGIVDNVHQCVTMDLKKPGNFVYIIGETREEMGGSIYLDTLGHLGRSVPKVNMKQGLKIFGAVEQAIQQGLIRSAHDCSEGGLAVALAEMALGSGLGLTAALKNVPFVGKRANDVILFSESNSRFIVEVAEEHQKSFEKICSRVPMGLIGRVKEEKEMTVYGLDEKICIKSPLDLLKESWQKTLRW